MTKVVSIGLFCCLVYVLFLQWSIIVTKSKLPFPHLTSNFPIQSLELLFCYALTQCSFVFHTHILAQRKFALTLQWKFFLFMTSEIESFKGYCYTPLYDNEQKWERKLQWRLLKIKFHRQADLTMELRHIFLLHWA